jgi:hypothetical protein
MKNRTLYPKRPFGKMLRCGYCGQEIAPLANINLLEEHKKDCPKNPKNIKKTNPAV